MKAFVLIFSLAMFLAFPARANPFLSLQCDITFKNLCTENGCESERVSTEYIVIDIQSSAYNLCSTNKIKCQRVQIHETKMSGAFFVVKFGGNSYIKIAHIDSSLVNLARLSFVEVRDNMLGVVTSFGKCHKL